MSRLSSAASPSRSHFMKYADFSLNFETVYYVLARDYNNVYMYIQQSIYFKINAAFEREGIEFAYSTQTLHMVGREPTPAQQLA